MKSKKSDKQPISMTIQKNIFMFLLALGYNNISMAIPNNISMAIPNNINKFIEIPITKPMITPVVKCCLDYAYKSMDYINYDCSQLSPFGKDRCNTVFNNNVCRWKSGSLCTIPKKCNRLDHYTIHFGKKINTGLCSGLCKEQKCKPKEYTNINVSNDLIDIKLGNKKEAMIVRVIKSCYCDRCTVEKYNKIMEIPVGKCQGKCQDLSTAKICKSGVQDNFNTLNSEVSNPSTLLVNGILSACSAGIQPGYDTFVNDRCFGHTFMNCFVKTRCPIKLATLEFCIRAANVPLTYTDSLILGINGVSLWSKRIPYLNSGRWNPGDTLCKTYNLNNLPIDGVSIINDIQSVGHLDVVVQDDTAVDFLKLNIEYLKCERCIATGTTINTMYIKNKIIEFPAIDNCDCINFSTCHREKLVEVHYTGTLYETIIDVGQCVGKCPYFNRCREKESSNELIQTPHGNKEIKKIKSCGCSKIVWNGNAGYITD